MYTGGLIASHCLLGSMQLGREGEDKRTILKEAGLG